MLAPFSATASPVRVALLSLPQASHPRVDFLPGPPYVDGAEVSLASPCSVHRLTVAGTRVPARPTPLQKDRLPGGGHLSFMTLIVHPLQ